MSNNTYTITPITTIYDVWSWCGPIIIKKVIKSAKKTGPIFKIVINA